MAQTASQFDWESARPVDEEPQQPAAAPAPDDTYPGGPLADQQTATPLSPALFDWQSARPVESSQEFDLESAQPLSELAKDPSYIMSRDQRKAYRQEANDSDSAVADFLSGIPMLVPGLINISAGTVNEAAQQLAQNLYRPDKLLAAFTANVNESQRQNILNYSKLFDYVYRNIRNSDTQRRREGAYGEQIKQKLGAQGKLTGDAFRDQEIVMQELYAAKERGEIPVSDEQRAEDDETDYQDYMRGLAFDQSIANITNVNVSGAPATVPDSRFIGRNILTGEAVMPGEFSPQALAIGTDPGNILAAGIGSLARVNALRRAGILLGKGLGPTGEAMTKAGGAIKRGADAVTERIQLSTGGQRVGEKVIGGLSPEMQTYGGGTAAAAVGYVTGGDTPLDQAMTGALALLPAVRMAGGTLRKAGAAANAGWIITREMDAGAMSAARVDAAKTLGANAAMPERYSRFIQNKGRASADSTLRRVAQDQANPRLLRSLSQFGDNVGLTSAVRATDDAIGGALVGASATAPFALVAPDAEQAGGIVGMGLMFGAVGGVAGGKMTRVAEMQDAMVARMLVDAQASGGNAEAFSRLPHQDLVSLAGLQAFSRGKLTFKPLTTSEYRVNLDVTKRRGENSAGFYVDTADDGTSTVFINMGEPSAAAGVVTKIRPVTKGGKTIEIRDKDGNSTFTYVPNESRIAVKQGDSVGVGTPLTRGTPSRLSVPEEIAHAIFSSKAMDGLPRDEMRNYINQRYKTEGVAARGREYAARIVDQDIAAGVYGAADSIDDAARDRLVEQRFTEFSQASIEDGADPLDWARDEIIAASLRASVQGIDLARLRNQSNFSRLAEQVVASSAQALRVLGVDVDKMGRVLDPAGTFRDNPVFADPAMRRMVTKYMRDYDQWLAGMEDAGRKDKRGVRVAPSGKVEDYANSQHTVLREIKDANGNGTGVFENDVVTRGPDGVVRPKKQSDIDRAEVSRAAQIKSLWDASKTVPTASTEFGKRRVNGRDIVGGPTLPKQFDLFTQFPQWIREFARQLEAGRSDGKTHIADYNAIGTGSSGRYRVTNLGNIEAILREVAFVGWQVTKKNHLLATIFDMNAFRAAAKRAIDNGELGEMGNNMDEVNATLLQYLDNHKNGRPGEYGIGQTKKSILNGLIGTGTAKQTAANPFYAELNPRGSVRTFRVDRLNDLRDTGRTGYNFMYEPINANMMPNRMPSALPQAGMAMPEVPVRGERADIPLNPRARRAAFISDRGEVRSTGRATHFETNEDLGPDFLAIGAGHLGEDGFFRFGSQTMDEAMGESPATSSAAAARYNQSVYDQGKRPSLMLEEPPGLERAAMRGQAMPDAEARSGAAETLDQLKRSQFIPTKVAAEVVGGFPEYLRPVAQFITDQRQKLAGGQMTRRDVMKAYAMTVASQGSGARAVEVIANNVAKDGVRFRPSKDFTTVDKQGRAAIRPEEAAAYWLGTDAGQRALDNFEAGRFSPDDWKELVAIRKAYGDDRFNNLGAFNPENIRTMDKVLADLNASRADTGKVMDAVQQLRGIKTGKKGFIAHLLGIGDVPTIDAVEINFWLTGKADIGKLNTRRATLARNIKSSISDRRVSQEMFRRIDQRINALRDEVPGGAEIAPEVWSHVMHHWLWDKSKGIETTHEGMYRAQAQFMPDVTVRDEGGTVWREIQDTPVVSLKDFEGRKVFAAFADLTSAGKIYRGIDSSEVAIPIETHGGPEWPMIQNEAVGEETNVWANEGKGIATKKLQRANEGAIMLIAAQHKNAHVSNTETATAVIATNAAYAKDGRITPENLATIDNTIRKDIPNFPGIEATSVMEFVNTLPFQGKKSRARIAEILESADMQKLGTPNVQRILDEMRSSEYDGLRIGDAVIAIELTPGSSRVTLGEQGTLPHPSYKYALRGRLIGRFARPINIESIFDDFYAGRRAEGKPTLGDRRAFDLAKPVQVITPAIAARVPGTPYNSFRSPRHAQIIKMALDDKWRSSADAVGKGGVSPAAFVDALNASPAKLALDRYTQDGLKAKIKTGEMSIHQLGDSQVFFGIKQGDPASAYGKDRAAFGFGPDEKTLSLVLNNERRTGGMADAIVMKSLQLGVTALDCFAVKSKKNPTGMLPELYENYGFERAGTVPFDPQYYSKTELADLKKYWKSTGWDDSLGLPEIVLMKWKGNNELRTKSLQEFAAENSASVQEAVGGRELYTDTRKLAQRNAGKGGKAKRRTRQGDARSGAGNQGDAGRGVRLSRGFLGAYDELLSLSPDELRNLGIK